MSTGAECNFIQKDDGTWIYELQDWPYGEWPEYTEYGPFDNYGDANNHLHRNHANPGGASVYTNPKFECKHTRLYQKSPDLCYDCGLFIHENDT